MTEKRRHVLVTGGGSGIGAQIAREFAATGAAVTILGRRARVLEEVVASTGALGVSCDVTSRQSVDDALQQARDTHGAISIAVANAGVALSNPLAKLSPDDVTTMLNVNVLGVFNIWQACLSDMQDKGWGRMIAIASSAGIKGYPYVSGYCAAKHAVVGLTRSLSLELAKTGITVNAICPGFVETPMLSESIANIVSLTGMSEEEAAKSLYSHNPMKKLIKVEEVASMALWLGSEFSGSVNGQALSINGGEI